MRTRFPVTILVAAALGAMPLPAVAQQQAAGPRPLLPALAPAPQPWASRAPLAVPGRSHLPPAVIGLQPSPADAARSQPLRVRAARDLPAVAWDSGLRLRGPWLAPSAPLARAASPGHDRLMTPWGQTDADPDRPSPASDPTVELVRRAALAARVGVQPTAAPFLRLAIPDPFETLTAVRLARPPADTDGPAVAYELPPRPSYFTPSLLNGYHPSSARPLIPNRTTGFPSSPTTARESTY